MTAHEDEAVNTEILAEQLTHLNASDMEEARRLLGMRVGLSTDGFDIASRRKRRVSGVPLVLQLYHPTGMTDSEDPLDLFDSSLGTIFSIPPIAFSTSGSYTYHPPNPSLKPIMLTLPSPPAELYTTLQANHVWLASVFLADQISSGHISVKSKRIAELGAGAGLPGITAAVSGAEDVVSSDWDTPDVLSAIKENFGNACSKGERWAVVGHTWGTDPSPLLSALWSQGEQREFDVLLLADTLWVTEAHSVLLDSIFTLLGSDGVAYIAAGLHTGWGPVERFQAAAEKRGGIVSPIKVVRWQAGGGWADHSLREEGLEEERGVVIYFTLQTAS